MIPSYLFFLVSERFRKVAILVLLASEEKRSQIMRGKDLELEQIGIWPFSINFQPIFIEKKKEGKEQYIPWELNWRFLCCLQMLCFSVPKRHFPPSFPFVFFVEELCHLVAGGGRTF